MSGICSECGCVLGLTEFERGICLACDDEYWQNNGYDQDVDDE